MPDFEFTSPEGKSYSVSGPAGATKEQAFAILQAQLKGTPAAKPEQSTTAYVGSMFGRGALGTAEPMLTAAGQRIIPGPVSELTTFVRGALSKLAPHLYGESPTQRIQQAEEKVLPVQNVQPTQAHPGTVRDLAGRAAYLLGAGAIPGAGEARAIESLPQAIERGAVHLGGAALGADTQHLLNELISSGTLGTPTTGKRQFADVAGAITGPGLTGGVINLGKTAANAAARGAARAGVKVGVGGVDLSQMELKRAAREVEAATKSAYSKERAALVDKIDKTIPGFSNLVNTAMRTGDTGLIAKAKDLARSNEATLALSEEQDRQLNNLLDSFAQKKFPAAPTHLATQKGREKYDALMGGFDRTLRMLKQRQIDYAQQRVSRPGMTPYGEQIRNTLEGMQTAARKQKNAYYTDAINLAEKANDTVPVGNIAVAARRLLTEDARIFQENPTLAKQIQKVFRIKAAGPTVEKAGVRPGTRMRFTGATAETLADKTAPVAQLISLRQELNTRMSELRTAASMGDTGATTKLQTYGELLKPVNEAVDSFKESGAPSAEALKAADQFYTEEYTPRYRRGLGRELLAMSRGEFSTDAPKIVSKLIMPRGNATPLREFLTLADKNPDLIAPFKSGVMDLVAQNIVRGGKVSQSALDAFKRNYHEQIQMLPWLASKLDSVQKSTNEILDHIDTVLQQKKGLADSYLRQIAQTDTAEAAVRKIINSPEYAKTLKENISTEGQQAIDHAIMLHVGRVSKPLDFLKTNEKNLRAVMGDEKFDQLVTLAQANMMRQAYTTPSTLDISGEVDPLAAKTGTSIPGAAATINALGKGFAKSKAYIISSHAMKFFGKLSKDDYERIMTRAIFDPEFRKNLTDYMKTDSKEAFKKFSNSPVILSRIAAAPFEPTQAKQQGAQP